MSPLDSRTQAAPSLRSKLFIAFAAVAFATAVCGALSLVFVNRIGSAITVYADVTSPLQTESVALVGTARQMRSYVFKAISEGQDPQTIATQLDLLDGASRLQLNTLRALADRVGLKVAVVSAEQLENQYVVILRNIIEKSQTLSATIAVNDERRARFERLRRKASDQLRSIAEQTDSFINESEEKAKIEVQAGKATVARMADLISEFFGETNPRMRSTYKLIEVVEQLDDIVKRLAVSDSATIAEVERAVNDTLRMINSVANRLRGRLRDTDGVEVFARLQQNLVDLRDSLLGDGGLITGHHAAIAAQAEINRDRKALEAINEQYFSLLGQIEKSVASRNSKARESAAANVVQARNAVIGTSLAAVLGALLLASVVARRITAPFDAEQELIVCNKRYAEIYGVTAEHTRPGTPLEAVLEHRLRVAADVDSNEDILMERLAAIRAGKPWFELNTLGDGRVIAMSFHPLPSGGSVALHEDVTERREAEQRIVYMAHHDALTNLPNRLRFREEITEALNGAAGEEKLAVLYIDLDHFKDVNDTLGHPSGDLLLRQVSERLRNCVRPSDAVARLGGDEFAVIQTASNQPVSATAMANRIIKELGMPFDLDGHQIVIGASIGISIAPSDGDDADALLKKADMALYRAKDDGRGIYCFFEPEMDARMQRRRALELDLRKALIQQQFEVHYQPLINLESNTISGFEALVRWRHPERGMVQPNDFIPLAEDTGLIGPIGNWVLNQACRDAVTWPDHVRIAVNLSPAQFNKTLVLDVVSALSRSGLAPGRLELEITETVLLQDTVSTIAVLNQLHDLGVRIVMDDFGTGYSSLGYLRKFPFDKIKIDRSFIHDMDDKAESIAIVRAVTGLSGTLGIATTAEGVETVEQFRQLKLEGCTEVQGFLISKPRPASELAELLGQPPNFGKAVA